MAEEWNECPKAEGKKCKVIAVEKIPQHGGAPFCRCRLGKEGPSYWKKQGYDAWFDWIENDLLDYQCKQFDNEIQRFLKTITRANTQTNSFNVKEAFEVVGKIVEWGRSIDPPISLESNRLIAEKGSASAIKALSTRLELVVITLDGVKTITAAYFRMKLAYRLADPDPKPKKKIASRPEVDEKLGFMFSLMGTGKTEDEAEESGDSLNRAFLVLMEEIELWSTGSKPLADGLLEGVVNLAKKPNMLPNPKTYVDVINLLHEQEGER